MFFRFIYEQSKKLHPNNYILINAKMKLGLLYGNYKPYILNTMSRPSIDRKIQVYQKTILYILQRKALKFDFGSNSALLFYL